MSLIGSLEDLGLGDILQIISLSQKSGVLVIRSDEGEGRIVFGNGLVRGARVKGSPTDLRAVLVGGGFVEASLFDRAERQAGESGEAIEDAVVRLAEVAAERIDSLKREAVEAAVMCMFGWRSGDFSFDVRERPDPEDPPAILSAGINAQYLAMECSRVSDEGGLGSAFDFGPGPAAADPDEMSAHEMFGVEPDEPEASSASSTPAEAEGVPVFDGEPLAGEAAPVVDAEPLDDHADPVLPLAEALPVSDEPREALVEAAGGGAPLQAGDPPAPATPTALGADLPNRRPPVVVIDQDLQALEWTKSTMAPEFPQVHIFQRGDLGLTRIRQYLARGELPLVLLSPTIDGVPLSGIPDAVDFARRLKGQAQRMRVAWLHEDGTEPVAAGGPVDGVVTRPAAYQLRNAGASGQRDAYADSLVRVVAALLSRPEEAARDGGASGFSPEALRRLKQATAGLREASSRGEVLPLVIRFAADRFARVAMFAVRDGVLQGMAQKGLARAGGPDDDGIRSARLEARSSAWIRQVLDTKAPLRGAPGDAGDRARVALLGDREPTEAYLAPIESAGQIVAILYADHLPDSRPTAETSALEVVLHHAGLALDRAALERALAEVEDGEPGEGESHQAAATRPRDPGGSPADSSRNPTTDRYR